MKLKKVLALLAASALMVAALAACGGKTGTTGTSNDPTPTATPTAAPTEDPNKYAVTKPITIEWWHAIESQYQPTLEKVVADFESKNPNINVEAIYQGSYADVNKKLMAAQAAGTTLPALTVAEVSYAAEYGSSGICEELDPYIQATGFDIKDFGEGLVKSTSYDGKQVSLPFQISTQIMYYNKTIADAEGITIPTKWSEMDEFINKAAKITDGKTDRYGAIFAGWNQWYYEPFFINNGVKVLDTEAKTTDLNGEKALSIAESIKKWCKEGKAYFGYGKDSSANMRQNFLDGKTFAVFHTTALYNMYKDNAKFEVGMAWLPSGDTSYSEVGGNILLIPAKNSQDVKNAAWALLSYLTSKDVNMIWATDTGYLPTRVSVTKTDAAKEFLKTKPAFQVVFDHLDDIQPLIQHPAYKKACSTWVESFAKAVIEDEDMKASMDNAKKLIDETLAEY